MLTIIETKTVEFTQLRLGSYIKDGSGNIYNVIWPGYSNLGIVNVKIGQMFNDISVRDIKNLLPKEALKLISGINNPVILEEEEIAEELAKIFPKKEVKKQNSSDNRVRKFVRSYNRPDIPTNNSQYTTSAYYIKDNIVRINLQWMTSSAFPDVNEFFEEVRKGWWDEVSV